MGRDTEIYTLNSKKAREKLHPHLILNSANFKKYISMRNSLFEKHNQIEDIVNFDGIIGKVETDFNGISPNELDETKRWLWENYAKERNYNKLDQFDSYLTEFGIEKVFDFRKDDAYSFMWQLSNYEDEFKLTKTGTGSDSSANIKADDFIQFLNYMILLTGKLVELDLSGYWPFATSYSKDEISTLKKIREKFINQKSLNFIVEREVNLITSSWNAFMNGPNGRDDEKSGPDSNTVWIAGYIFTQSIKMKRSILKSKTNVIICDSI